MKEEDARDAPIERCSENSVRPGTVAEDRVRVNLRKFFSDESLRPDDSPGPANPRFNWRLEWSRASSDEFS